MLLQPEGAAVKGARHVEGAVAVLPAPVAERDQHLILGHEFAVKPGEAGIRWLRLGHLCILAVRINLPFSHGGNVGTPRVWNQLTPPPTSEGFSQPTRKP